MSSEKRAKLLHQASRILKEHLQWMPLWKPADIYGTLASIDWVPRSNEGIRT